MSLNEQERRRTAQEIVAHADALGLAPEDIARHAGMDREGVEAVLTMRGPSPVDVWAVRDVLHAEALRRGVDAGGWSVLSDEARTRATQWFALRDVG